MHSGRVPGNRRDAKDAETDQSQSSENLSLKGDWLGQPLPPPFLCALRVSAVQRGFRQLHDYGLAAPPAEKSLVVLADKLGMIILNLEPKAKR